MVVKKVSSEFQEAALRHLKVCRELQRLAESDASADLNSRRYIIEDLYYLSGYIIECSCCWFIFSHFDYTRREDLIPTDSYNVAYDKNKRRDLDTFIIKQKDHVLREFTKVSSCFDTVPSHAPIINGHKTAFVQKNCLDLFNQWSANVRYHINFVLEPQKVFNFFEVAVIIYDAVENHITL